MKYPLMFYDSCPDSFRFWMEKFFHFKLITLSGHRVVDKDSFAVVLRDIQSGGKNSADRIRFLCKKSRKLGLIGINVYSNPVLRLYDFLVLCNLDSMEDIDTEFVLEFLGSYACNLSEASKKSYQIALSNFFDFLNKNNFNDGRSHRYDIDINSSARRFKSDLPDYLDESELVRFLDAVNEYKAKTPDITCRNKLIIKLILYSGARVSEVLSLSRHDVLLDGEYYSLRLRGKGNRVRIVFVKKQHVYSELKNWFSIRELMTRCVNSDLLFLSKKGKPITQTQVYLAVEGILLGCGIRKRKNGAHMLRHSFATFLYRKSKDLVLVQESLGHSTVETSRVYTHFDSQRLKGGADIMGNLTK